MAYIRPSKLSTRKAPVGHTCWIEHEQREFGKQKDSVTLSEGCFDDRSGVK